jgi:hypothetical protein
MKKTWVPSGFAFGSRRGTFPIFCGTTNEASSHKLILFERSLRRKRRLVDAVHGDEDGLQAVLPHAPHHAAGHLRLHPWRAVASAERCAPHSHGVDFIDEDDRLPAPLAREAASLPHHELDDHHVHADERLRERRARHDRDGRVERGRDGLREHRLAGAWRAEEQDAPLALAA